MNRILQTTLAAVAVGFSAAGENTNISFNAGADLRVRQEIMKNVPGLPGNPDAMMSRKTKKNVNHIRVRPRVWARADAGPFGLYLRVANEFREHIVRNGVRRQNRSYNFPDEWVIDSLYLEGRDLFDEFLDFRIGRQDLFDGRHSVLGLDRIMLDGAPYVGSRSCYADMARFTLKPTETGKLDLFGLYDSGRNYLRWGHMNSKYRPMNAIHPADDCGMDEWGFGAAWYDRVELTDGYKLPYRFYVVNKNNTHYRRFNGTEEGGKHVTVFGGWTRPQIAETLFLEFEGAGQTGHRSGDGQTGGWLGYGAFEWRKNYSSFTPYARVSAYYLSHDWDPMWARAPCDSELFQYGTLYGLGYWSNMLYTKLTLGTEFGPHHAVSAYTGPMWAAENDHDGRIAGEGGSTYKGFLSAIRYDFPILLAPKNAKGIDRFEIFGHIMGELFHPGDYYETSKPAWFIRWEVIFKF